jgi:hypothetical protein
MITLQDAGIDNVFFWINPVEKCIFSAVLCQQRKSDVMTNFGHSARSAVYYEAGSPLLVTSFFAFLCWLQVTWAFRYTIGNWCIGNSVVFPWSMIVKRSMKTKRQLVMSRIIHCDDNKSERRYSAQWCTLKTLIAVFRRINDGGGHWFFWQDATFDMTRVDNEGISWLWGCGPIRDVCSCGNEFPKEIGLLCFPFRDTGDC